jgi:hypothetical protein
MPCNTHHDTIQFGCKNIAFLRYNHYVMRYFFKNIAIFSPFFFLQNGKNFQSDELQQFVPQ